jgi:S-adenosylmethionine decarboxylase
MDQQYMSAASGVDPSMAPYTPGLHLIVDGVGIAPSPLGDVTGFQEIIHERIIRLGLVSIGAVHHAFPGGGFTSVVCLTESHLSIHTWPEHGRVTFDVFLSNFSRVNDAAAESLVGAIKEFLGAGHYTEHRLRR